MGRRWTTGAVEARSRSARGAAFKNVFSQFAIVEFGAPEALSDLAR
jgi:hypothetical protein